MVTIRCDAGHRYQVGHDVEAAALACPTCGSRRVATVQAPAPRIRAVGCDVEGPLVIKETGHAGIRH